MAGGKKILVVDDEVTILLMMKTVFGQAGYEVFTAENAEIAMAVTLIVLASQTVGNFPSCPAP